MGAMIGLRGGGAAPGTAATGRRRWLVRAAALVLVIGGAGAMARSGGPRTLRVDLRPGGAWVASPTVGLMTLIDGESAQVVARVAVGPPSADLVAAQAGTTAYAVDGTRGTVAPVDPRTFAASAPTAVVTGATRHVVARATAAAVYVV